MLPITLPSPLPFPITLKNCPFSEYKHLAHFHYRPGPPGPVDQCFGLYIPSQSHITTDPHLIAVIVYSLPPLNSHLRTLATDHRYQSVNDLRSRTLLLNREIRTIARVVVHPQFRSLGLATALVQHTLPLANTPFVEASAVMGLYHPFFQKAGMTMYTAPLELKNEILLAAFDHVQITPNDLRDHEKTLTKIHSLPPRDKQFLLTQIQTHYVTARRAAFSSHIGTNLDWLLPRLTSTLFTRPAYFLWKNPLYSSKFDM